ncbi:MAG: pentapeptide repeat-containing protein [Firmicutes bacterium]|nr:pentapeptide repeat-containing protein [Bacillota bacterium]
MEYDKLLPHFSEAEINEATSVLYEFSDNRACSNNRLFKKAIKATYSGNYKRMSLKRTFLKECTIKKANFNGSAVTGSKFIQTLFEDCKILGASFQCCDFIESKFHDFSSKIKSSNFSNSLFIDTEFKNVNFYMSTIFQSLFENCVFTDCIVETTTLEGSVFRDCIFNHVDLSNLNIDYVTLYNPVMHDVIFPFFQVPYIINGFSFLHSNPDKNDIWIDSKKSPHGKISVKEYLNHTNELITYFYGLKEFFPLANIFLAKNDVKTALVCIMEGIERASKQNDFRMIKHFCRLVTSTPQFTTNDVKEVQRLVENRFNPGSLTSYELHNYLLNIGEIREILLNGNYNLPRLEITIQTNIDPNESEKLAIFLEKLNKLLYDHNINKRSQRVTLSHNSDYALIISCAGPIISLLQLIATVYYSSGMREKPRKKVFTNNDQTHEEPMKTLFPDESKQLYEDGKQWLTTNVVSVTHFVEGVTNKDISSDWLVFKSTVESPKYVNTSGDLGEN